LPSRIDRMRWDEAMHKYGHPGEPVPLTLKSFVCSMIIMSCYETDYWKRVLTNISSMYMNKLCNEIFVVHFMSKVGWFNSTLYNNNNCYSVGLVLGFACLFLGPICSKELNHRSRLFQNQCWQVQRSIIIVPTLLGQV
jgi:hypothetical protein